MDLTSMIIGWLLGVVSAAIYMGRQRRDAKHRKAWNKQRQAGSRQGQAQE